MIGLPVSRCSFGDARAFSFVTSVDIVTTRTLTTCPKLLLPFLHPLGNFIVWASCDCVIFDVRCDLSCGAFNYGFPFACACVFSARCRSSDGLSLFVSSTDGYVSKIHFEHGELGSIIPESDVPSQTRRLHPVIYGWRQETAHGAKAASRIPTAAGRIPTAAPRPISDECQASTPRDKGDDSIRARESGEPGPDTMAAKPKKKIAPTLVTPGHRSPVDVESVPSAAVPPSPTLPSAERKKRRITPTLVHGTNDTEDGRAMPGTRGVSSNPAVGEEAPQNTLSAVPHASGSGLDQTPKRKRLTPTLVSAL